MSVKCVECGSLPVLRGESKNANKHYSCGNKNCEFRYFHFPTLADWDDKMTRWSTPTGLVSDELVDIVTTPVYSEDGGFDKAAQAYITGSKRVWPWDITKFVRESRRDDLIKAVNYLLMEITKS